MIREVVASAMESLGLPYALLEYPRTDEKLYFVGERIESPHTQEDGAKSGTFVVSGWSYSGASPLCDAEKRISEAFDDMRVRGEAGTCCVGYSHAMDVPSDVEGVSRTDFTLDYKEWSR